jgi:ribokinase
MTTSAARPVLVAGAINTDLVARVAKAPAAGETVTGSAFAIFGGGKGANQAIASARSGAPTAMLGALGDDDFGRARRADLDAEGIDTGSVARHESEPSGVALIVVEEGSGQNRISYVPGATLTIRPAQARHAVKRVQPAVVLTTLEPVPETIAALIESTHAGGGVIVLNASPEPLGARPFLPDLDTLIVNETEAEELLGAAVTVENSGEAALSLAKLGPRTVVVTLGPAGAVVAHAGETRYFPAPQVTPSPVRSPPNWRAAETPSPLPGVASLRAPWQPPDPARTPASRTARKSRRRWRRWNSPPDTPTWCMCRVAAPR